MNTALIIGGTGLLGRGVADVLMEEGWRVTLLSRSQRALPHRFADCEQIIADRRQAEALQQACQGKEFNAVIDCAAYSRKDAESAVETFKGTVLHYWFISSDFVYDADPAARFPLSENAKTQTSLPYAVGKLEAEAFLLAAAQEHSFPVTILRPPHILGAGRPAGCDPAAGGRDDKLVERIRCGMPIPLLAEGLFLIQPIWSREIGRCVHQLNGNPNAMGHLFNIAGAECITTLEYYQTIAELEHLELKIASVSPRDHLHEFPDKAHFLRHRIYNTSPLKALGFVPTLSLRDAIRDTLSNSN